MNIQGVIKIHRQDSWSWMYIPLLVVSSSFLVALIISLFLQSSQRSITAGVSYIVVYVLVMGIVVIHQTFSYAISMSIRRIDYYVGTGVFGALFSFITALALVLLSTLERLTNGWGLQLQYYSFPYINDGSILEQFLIYLFVLSNFFFLGFFIGFFWRKVGGKGFLLYSLAVVLLCSTAVTLIHYNQAWSDIFQWFAGNTAFELALWLLPFTLIYIGLSFLFVRKITV